ncbi:O-antigen ligase family protein [Deinococcus sp. Marseille-Q6407]|uniref:O-antigen ligase family protein n=1 Tax=Deinococcus sp. Marseille-Q6407 TaxID=2969223 RepID=UPI0021BF6B0F|nr:O-antigen ligase family protein [Deinococcus sp. Marseille-Q6407]
MPHPATASTPPQRLFSWIGTDTYWLVVGLLLFFFVVPHTNSEGYFVVGKLAALAAITLLTGTFIWLNRQRFRFSAPRPVLWLVLGYLAWITVTNTLTASHPEVSVIGWPGWRSGLLTNALYWATFLLALCRPVSGAAETARHERQVWPLLLGFLGVISLWSSAEFVGLRPLLGNPYLGPLQGAFSVTAFPILTVGNSGWISGIWPLLTPLALLFARRRHWPLLLLSLAFLLLGVASTQGNLAALVFSGQMLLFAVLTVRRSWLAALLLAGAAFLPPAATNGLVELGRQVQNAGWAPLQPADQENQFNAGTTAKTTSERLLIFTSGLRSAAARPLTGWGYETFQNNFYSHLTPEEREPFLRKIVGAQPDERVGVSGLAAIAQKEVNGETVTRERTLLMIKPHNYLIEEVYSNGFPVLLFLLPLLGLIAAELLKARTELALLAFFGLLGYGGFLMGWFLNPSVTPLALAVLALGLRSADRLRSRPVAAAATGKPGFQS